jgi:methyl-accepting chemotaxis protein
MTIGQRMLGVLLVAALVAGGLSYAVYARATHELVEAASEKYLALAEIRREALLEFLGGVKRETLYWSADAGMRSALLDFVAGWHDLGADAPATLQRLYVHENPNTVGEKDELEDAGDGSAYSKAHAGHHFWLQRFLVHRGFYDVFLFDLEGNLVYTAFKESDYATNLVTGPMRETPLGEAFRAARANPKPGFVAFFDFAPYAPSFLEAAAFVSAPVLSEEGELLGVLAFQLPVSRVDEIMQAEAGMGATGETYIVGPDLMMRSDSRFAQESTILNVVVDTPTARRALAGESGVAIIPDYRGVRVLSAHLPLEFSGIRWAIMSEVDEAEVLTPVVELGRFLVLAGGGGLLLLLVGGILASRRT